MRRHWPAHPLNYDEPEPGVDFATLPLLADCSVGLYLTFPAIIERFLFLETLATS